MQASRLLILLLLAAAVLVDLVMLSVVGSSGDGRLGWPHPLLAVLFSLAFSQVSMAAVWAGLSETSLPWRVAGLVGVVTVWSVALTWGAVDAGIGYGRDDWSVFLLGHALLIISILLAVRARGGRLANSLKTNAEPREGRWQFSLGYLFAWLTATCVSLGMLRYTVDFDSLLDGRDWNGLLLVGLSNAVISWAALWAGFGGKRPVSRVVVLCLGAVGVLSLPLFGGSGAVEIHLSWAVLWILQIAWLAAWVFVLRMAGVGFVWRERGR